jgi:hypothetical protein
MGGDGTACFSGLAEEVSVYKSFREHVDVTWEDCMSELDWIAEPEHGGHNLCQRPETSV